VNTSAHRYWLLTADNKVFLTASTLEWARRKVAAFAFCAALRIEDRDCTERLEERGIVVV
jgi:hypothetical protein